MTEVDGLTMEQQLQEERRKREVLRGRLESLCKLWQRTDPGIAAIIRSLLEELK